MTVSDITPQLAERAAAQAPAVTVFGKPNCVQCTQTVKLMDRENIVHTYVDITEDETAYRYVTEVLEYSAAPVVVVDHPGAMGVSSWYGFRMDLIQSIKEWAA